MDNSRDTRSHKKLKCSDASAAAQGESTAESCAIIQHDSNEQQCTAGVKSLPARYAFLENSYIPMFVDLALLQRTALLNALMECNNRMEEMGEIETALKVCVWEGECLTA
eukprot:GDKI01031025.1.p1 GENE.GDKI01031025.1~~GDKI01031025.1.p1  ORF type:complete len:110 (-),score=14.76 GDKI01031025.1:33-362(-)